MQKRPIKSINSQKSHKYQKVDYSKTTKREADDNEQK